MKKSELKALIREVVQEARSEENYMLYSNGNNESLAYGDIEYIAEHLSDYITGGQSEKLPIQANEQAVAKVIRDYNAKHSYGLMLLKSIV